MKAFGHESRLNGGPQPEYLGLYSRTLAIPHLPRGPHPPTPPTLTERAAQSLHSAACTGVGSTHDAADPGDRRGRRARGDPGRRPGGARAARLAGGSRDHFDFVAGTSTGALIAAAVAAGIPAERIVQMYVERAPKLFTKLPVISTIRRILSGRMYDVRAAASVHPRGAGERGGGRLAAERRAGRRHDHR